MKTDLRKNRVVYLLVFLTLMLGSFQASSQSEEPVKWVVSASHNDGKAKLEFKATIDEGWHLYALELPSDEGPIPTEVVFNEGDGYTLVGKVLQEEPLTTYDPNFDMEILYFEHETTFTQEMVLSGDKAEVTGYITFMVCNDERCLPPVDHEFKVTID